MTRASIIILALVCHVFALNLPVEESSAEMVMDGSGVPLPPSKNISAGPMIPPKNPEEQGSGDDLLGDNSGDFGGGAEGEPESPIPAAPDFATGAAEESTMNPPVDHLGENPNTDEPDDPNPVFNEEDKPTTPFDINNMETGVPEGPTKEPYYPKPNKPKPGQEGDGSGAPLVTDDYVVVTDHPGSGESELPNESIAPEHWRTPTTRRYDFTISQKMDENSPGYKQLLHMLEDLNTRRKEDTTGTNQTDYYIERAGVIMDTIDNSFTNPALANISAAQEYIKGLLGDASLPVRQGYAQIVSLTSTPSFYYIPKKQRYLMVTQIITDMGDSGEQELMSLNRQAKTFCQKSNVDTPPYTLGNISGNKLGNGAILTK